MRIGKVRDFPVRLARQSGLSLSFDFCFQQEMSIIQLRNQQIKYNMLGRFYTHSHVEIPQFTKL